MEQLHSGAGHPSLPLVPTKEWANQVLSMDKCNIQQTSQGKTSQFPSGPYQRMDKSSVKDGQMKLSGKPVKGKVHQTLIHTKEEVNPKLRQEQM